MLSTKQSARTQAQNQAATHVAYLTYGPQLQLQQVAYRVAILRRLQRTATVGYPDEGLEVHDSSRKNHGNGMPCGRDNRTSSEGTDGPMLQQLRHQTEQATTPTRAQTDASKLTHAPAHLELL